MLGRYATNMNIQYPTGFGLWVKKMCDMIPPPFNIKNESVSLYINKDSHKIDHWLIAISDLTALYYKIQNIWKNT